MSISDENLVHILLPRKYRRWVDEYLPGAKWACGQQFLFKVLPLLARLFVQDGIYRTVAYPNHTTTLMLMNAFGQERYTPWAEKQRQKVSDLRSKVIQNNLKNLERAHQDAYVYIRQDVTDLKKEVRKEFKLLRDVILTQGEEKENTRNARLLLRSAPATCQRQDFSGPTRDRMVALVPATSTPPLIPEELPINIVTLLEHYFEHGL
jgi:hypothetical protein